MIMCLKCSRGPMDAAPHCSSSSSSPRLSSSSSSIIGSSDEIDMPRSTGHYLRPSLRPRLRAGPSLAPSPRIVSGSSRLGSISSSLIGGTPSARVTRFHGEAQVFTFEPQVELHPEEVAAPRTRSVRPAGPRRPIRVKYPARRDPRRGPPSEKNPAKGWLAFFAVVVAFQVFNAAENLDDHVSGYNLEALEKRLCALEPDATSSAQSRAAVWALHRYLSVHSHAEPLVLWLHGCSGRHADAIAAHFGEATARLNVRGAGAAFDLRARLGGVASSGAEAARGGEKIPVMVLEGDSEQLTAALRTLPAAAAASSASSSWSSSHSWFSAESRSSSGAGGGGGVGGSNVVLVLVQESVAQADAAAAELQRLVELGAISEHSAVVNMGPGQ